MDKSDPSYKGQSRYNAAMLAIYDVWVQKFMTKAVWKVPVALGVDRYRQHMGAPAPRHWARDRLLHRVGGPARDTAITLLDPNQTCFATWRSGSRNKAVAVRNIADVLSPEGVLFGGTVLGLQGNHTKAARVPASSQQARGLRQRGRHG